jgi:hypothetical protein
MILVARRVGTAPEIFASLSNTEPTHSFRELRNSRKSPGLVHWGQKNGFDSSGPTKTTYQSHCTLARSQVLGNRSLVAHFQDMTRADKCLENQFLSGQLFRKALRAQV